MALQLEGAAGLQEHVGAGRGDALLGAAEEHQAPGAAELFSQLGQQVGLADAAGAAEDDDAAEGLQLLVQLHQLAEVRRAVVRDAEDPFDHAPH